MNLVYIHGAKATSNSFNYIKTQLDGYKYTNINYDSNNGFYNNLTDMYNQIGYQKNLVFIAHSLGGIYALHLYNKLREQTVGGFTMSTPYGGSTHAQYLKYFTMWLDTPLLNDITPNSMPIVEANLIKVTVPWTNIVSTAGHLPILGEPNDGVVTLASMKSRREINHVSIDTNHYEVVQSPETIKHLKTALENLYWKQLF